MYRYLLLLSVCIGLTTYAHAQEVNTGKPGQLLVQLNPQVDAFTFTANLNESQPNIEVKVIRQVSRSMNIWLLGFNEKNISNPDFLILMRNNDLATEAQYNRTLSKRSGSVIPNDLNFNKQWQYINNGGSGGVAGADIDADSAWAITTGGLTANGDTIVVAVLDDGIDPSHPDIEPNLWVNYNEIPNNGIDDDGNGFIDDYRGWNAYELDDDIEDGFFGGWHGTPVAGIIGAKGNDGAGVCGVNWDVKLMIVVGGGDEAEAVAAYDYVLEMRKLYNQTQGAKGAYVVATNASWGLDFTFASSAPLWCAMYDSLGKYGVLNAGATMNEDSDVEVDGDMPSTCGSEHLVVVTNTKRNDQKELYAAYGTTSVDLGAPGEDAWTVDVISGEAGFGGTSGATPHVAGAIGLLYSVPCQSFADYALEFPDTATLLVKQFLLEGADSNTSLQNITVSGGRLNVYNSMKLMLDFCEYLDSIQSPPVGLSNPGQEPTVIVYPNPAQHKLVIEHTGITLVNGSLVNMLGQTVMNFTTQHDKTTLNIAHLPEGSYVIDIQTTDGVRHAQRLLIQRR